MSSDLRLKGNQTFQARNFAHALSYYTTALGSLSDTSQDTPEHLKLLVNISTTRLKLGHAGQAKTFAQEALKIDPTFVKGVYRFGQALVAEHKYDEGGWKRGCRVGKGSRTFERYCFSRKSHQILQWESFTPQFHWETQDPSERYSEKIWKIHFTRMSRGFESFLIDVQRLGTTFTYSDIFNEVNLEMRLFYWNVSYGYVDEIVITL